MIADWLLDAAAEYNKASLEARDNYPAHVLMPVETLAAIIDWSFRSLPDEILVGIDADSANPNPKDVDEAFGGSQTGMFAGQGYLMALLLFGGVNTALSLFYYLRVVKVMILEDPPDPLPLPLRGDPIMDIQQRCLPWLDDLV